VNCWKSLKGQSAAKIYRNIYKVQRLVYGVLTGGAEDSKTPRAQNND
jgi:hypothetical protein